MGALSVPFFKLSESTAKGNDYARDVLAEELFAYSGAFAHFCGVVFDTLGDNPETINDGVDREETNLILRGSYALSERGIEPARKFHEKHKDRLEGRMVIPESRLLTPRD